MKTRPNAAFTVLDLIIVIATLVLVAVFLPILARPKTRICRVQCSSNLRQIGLALRMWANDNSETFPMQLADAKGGTKESALQGLPLASFMIISNELNNPKPLHCPDDKERKPATNFAQLSATNLSYFLGVDASETKPQIILSGDRNLNENGQPTKGFVQITNPLSVLWSTSIHTRQGYIGLGDGSAHQVTDQLLQKQLIATGLATNRFAIP